MSVLIVYLAINDFLAIKYFLAANDFLAVNNFTLALELLPFSLEALFNFF